VLDVHDVPMANYSLYLCCTYLVILVRCLVGSVNHVIMLVCEASLKWLLLMLHYA